MLFIRRKIKSLLNSNRRCQVYLSVIKKLLQEECSLIRQYIMSGK